MKDHTEEAGGALTAGSEAKQDNTFLQYRPSMDIGELEHWPFDNNPKSNYVVRDGTDIPKAFGRIDSSTPTSRVGIWKCTKGSFECTEQGDELMTVLQGVVTLTDLESGQFVRLKTGDTMFSRDGKRVLWEIEEDFVKVFYGSKPDGF
jgi:uncharacterized cupin superfamily protein